MQDIYAPEIKGDMVVRMEMFDTGKILKDRKKERRYDFWRGVIYSSLGWTFFVLLFTYWVVSNLS